MIAAIHQPDYIPYLGYFYKMSRADVFIYLDDAQYSKGDRHEWNDIKSPNGKLRLKIPIRYHFGCPMTEVQTNREIRWEIDHLFKINENYVRSAFRSKISKWFVSALLREHGSLAELNIDLNTYIARRFGFDCRFVRSSALGIQETKTQRLVDLCRAVGADTYLSGTGAKDYQDEELFERAGIRVVYSDFRPIQYPQCWGKFMPNLSVIDFLYNCGYNFSKYYGERS